MKTTILGLAAALAAIPLLAARAALPETTAVGHGVAYIESQQQPDGGYGTLGAGAVADAIFAVRASGKDPNLDAKDGKTPADYLRANAANQPNAASDAKLALAAKALGIDSTDVGGTNLVAKATAAYDAATGRYAADDFSQSIVMLGLACTANPLGGGAAAALTATQDADGGWGFGGASDPDTSAIAVQALLAAGTPKSDAHVVKALAYFKATQGNDGGWGFDPDASNTSSTAYVVQALLALGEPVESAAYTKGGATPVTFLLSQQQADGSFTGFSPLVAANQAVPALAGRTFCNAAATSLTATGGTPTPTATASVTSSATATLTPTPTITATNSATPVATAVTSTASPRPSASATARVTPAAPKTGSGNAAGSHAAWWLALGLGALALVAGAALAVRAHR